MKVNKLCIIKCILDVRDLIALERVASLSNKILRYAYIDLNDEVKFIQVEHHLIK